MKLLLLLLLIVYAIAISECCGQVYVGPVAGGQISWTKLDNRDYYNFYKIKPVLGYHGGANLSLKVRNRFFLHASFLYSTKGKKVEGRADPLLKNVVRYNFIEVPVIYAVDFRAQIGKGKAFKYYFGLGPNISYWLGGKGKLYNSDLDENADFSSRDLEYTIVFRKDADQARTDQMNVSEPNRFQLGLNAASGLVFEPGRNQRVLLMIRYELGHSFFSKTSNGTFIPTYYEDLLQSRSKGLKISLSYMIDLHVQDRKRGKSNSTIRRGGR